MHHPASDRSWPKIASHFDAIGVRCGHKAAILILELRISVGSLTAARRNYLGVRCVPFSAPGEVHLSVR